MFTPPLEFPEIISGFSPLFSKKIFERAGQLLLGTILTQGKRTVCSVLQTLGMNQITNWDLYHRVLSRANWSAFKCSQKLLMLLIKNFCSGSKLVFALDDTLERRWGRKIKARGIYHDAVRSTNSCFVKASGLRWICLMLLSTVKWTDRVWALPFFTVLAPSARYHKKQGKRHKKLGDWARQMALVIHRWLPDFQCIIVADGSYAVMELLASTKPYVNWIVRFRLNARLHDFPPPYRKGQMGRPPQKGRRQPLLKERLTDEQTKWQRVRFSKWYGEQNKQMEIASGKAIWYRAGKAQIPIKWVLVRDPKGKHDPVAILCTDLTMARKEIVQHFVKRWQVEVTFEEVRAHLGVETQRQWSDLSIARTTPVLMALFSIITIWANHLYSMQKLTVFQTAWYQKPYPTFSDAVASVRYRIWQFQFNSHSSKKTDCEKIKQLIIKHLAFMAARAA